jgi:hypothetical protein
VYKHVEVARTLTVGERIYAYCPSCLPAVELRLFGPRIITIEKRWCRCGREIVTGKQVCEFCETAPVPVPAHFDVEQLR